MTNVKAFDVNGTIDKISDYAPVVLFAMMVIMFSLTGWMQYHFLNGLLAPKMPGNNYLIFFFPIVIQILRFITGFLSASFFKKGRWFFGSVVFLFSIWLSLYEYGEIEQMAAYWRDLSMNLKVITHSELVLDVTDKTITGIMTVLIWGALVLEFFLAAWIGSSAPQADDKQLVSFSSNGAHKKRSKSMS